MEYNIYVDVFFLLNFIVNLFLTIGVGLLLKCPLHFTRFIVAAAFASIVNCILLFVSITVPFSRLFIAIGMALLGYGINSIKDLLMKTVSLFFLAVALEGFLRLVPSIWALLGILFICYIIGAERRKKENRYRVLLTFKGKTTLLHGFYDTGNLLAEPLTGRMVHIASYDAVKKVLPECYQQIVEEYFQTGILESTKVSKLQMYEFTFLSYHSIGKETGELLGIRMDTAVYIGNAGKKTEKKAVIALTNQKELMKDHCQIIMNGRLEI